ncbi:MAG: hypothetical protein MI802_24445 [Desulfobacterales bacterium]|nr:hypothetical protein [Desulfobacterales bacterium]
MRFLLSLFVWIFFVGGLWAYTANRDATLPEGPARVADREIRTGEYTLEITPGFSIEADPFALALDDTGRPLGLEVRLNGQILEIGPAEIFRGKVITVTKGIFPTIGFNEFYVKAAPPMSESHLDHCVRVRLLDSGIPVADRTIWGSRGAVVAGTVGFTMAKPKENDHDH